MIFERQADDMSIIPFVLMLFFPPSQAFSQNTDLYGNPLLAETALKFRPTGSLYSCGDLAKIKKIYLSEKSPLPNRGKGSLLEGHGKWKGDFVFIDSNAKAISICRHGKSFSAQLDLNKGKAAQASGLELELFVNSYEDINKDGTPEFVLGEVSCSGICTTDFTHLVTVDENTLIKVVSFRAEFLSIVKENDDFLLKVVQVCRTEDSDSAPGPTFFKLAFLNSKNKISFIPYKNIRNAYRGLLPDIKNKSDTRLDGRIQNLFNRAYHGEPKEKLLAEARQIGADWGNCSTAEIIKEILGSSKKSSNEKK